VASVAGESSWANRRAPALALSGVRSKEREVNRLDSGSSRYCALIASLTTELYEDSPWLNAT
jgi:hypothetical protein